MNAPLVLELVSKELNHFAGILHVYAGDLHFMKKKNVIIEKKKGNTFTLLIIFIVKVFKKWFTSMDTNYLWTP